MKRIVFGLAALACMGSAHAADLPPTPDYRAPAMVAPSFNWTGFYLGVMGGYAKGAGDLDLSGGIAGETVGYNFQPAGSAIVFGVEADGGWSNFGQSASGTGGGVTVTFKTKADAIATFRARIGAAFGQSLIYVTGGGAWGRNTISVSATAGAFTIGISDSQNHMGYAVGGGFEQALTNNWSVKGEYLYLGLGSENYFGSVAAGGLASGDIAIHTIKFGVNYRF